tara:strand:- start:241 stop:384 length:144 start_codon:yes stop_codon:yes gene_type:complete
MKVSFKTPKGFKVIIEPLEKQTVEQLEKKAKQIMSKRGIVAELTIEP